MKIVSFLQHQVSCHPSISGRQDAAFQLAVCYRIGFGTIPDESQVARCLDSAHRNVEDLESEIDLIKGTLFGALIYHNGALNNFIDRGVFHQESLGKLYAKDNNAEEYSELLQKEIQETRRIFGPATSACADLSDALFEMLFAQGKLDNAESVLLEMIQDLRGEEKADLAVLEQRVRTIEQRQVQNGTLPNLSIPDLRSTESELVPPIAERIIAMVDERNPRSLTSLKSLAAVWNNQGRLSEASWLQAWLTSWYVKYFGKAHPNTLRLFSDLVSTYKEMNKLQAAEDLMNYVSTMSESSLGLENQDTLIALMTRAQIHVEQKDYSAAESVIQRAIDIQKGMFRPNSAFLNKSTMILGNLYREQNRFREAEDLLQKTYEASQILLGESDPETILAMHLLVLTYQATSQFNKAEETCLKALAIGECATVAGTNRHPIFLRIHRDLGTTYLLQHRLVEAEQIAGSNLEESREILGEDAQQTTNSIDTLATILHKLDRCDEENALLEGVISRLEAKNGRDHWLTLYYKRKRAGCLWKEGKWLEAVWHSLRFYPYGTTIRVPWRNYSASAVIFRTPALILSLLRKWGKLVVNLAMSWGLLPQLRQ